MLEPSNVDALRFSADMRMIESEYFKRKMPKTLKFRGKRVRFEQVVVGLGSIPLMEGYKFEYGKEKLMFGQSLLTGQKTILT